MRTRLVPICWIFGLFLGGDLVTSRIEQADAALWGQVVFYGLAALLTAILVARQRVPVVALLGAPTLSWRGAAGLLGLALATTVVLGGYFALLRTLGVPMLDETAEFKAAGWPVWSTFALVALAPAMVEEVAFRGLILEILMPVLARRDALIVQAALFSVLHLWPMIFASHFVLGLLLGWMRLRSRSLYPSMLFHAGWNGLVIALDLWPSGGGPA